MSAVEVVDITYFSDVLCIWAYISQARVDAVTEKFGDPCQWRRQIVPNSGVKVYRSG